MSIDSSDAIYIASSGTTMRKYTTAGATLLTITGLSSSVFGVAVSPTNGNIYVAYNNATNYIIGQFASAGGAVVLSQIVPGSGVGLWLWCDAGGNVYVIANTTNNKISKYDGTFTTTSLAGSLSAVATPNHYVATYDGTTLRYYINGSMITSGAVTIAQSPGANLTVGAYSFPIGGTALAGTIGNVAIYSTALTGAQVSSLYNAL